LKSVRIFLHIVAQILRAARSICQERGTAFVSVQDRVHQRENSGRSAERADDDHSNSGVTTVVNRFDPQLRTIIPRRLHCHAQMVGDSIGGFLTDGVRLHDARNLGASARCDAGIPAVWAGDRLDVFTCDSILFADAHRLQTPSANIAAHGPYPQTEAFGYLLQ
jgi:hypothetical protein